MAIVFFCLFMHSSRRFARLYHVLLMASKDQVDFSILPVVVYYTTTVFVKWYCAAHKDNIKIFR